MSDVSDAEKLHESEGSRPIHAVRSALIRLESAWNAGSTPMLRPLFAEGAHLINQNGAITNADDPLPCLERFLFGAECASGYCTLSTIVVTPLSEALMYAAFTVQAWVSAEEPQPSVLARCSGVFRRAADSGPSAWQIQMLHLNSCGAMPAPPAPAR